MNRWIATVPALLVATAGAALAQSPAAPAVVSPAVIREAPRDVQPARMVVTLPPQITLDGAADRLSPGARIRDTRNLLALSGSLAGRDLPVVYRRDGAGLVHEVWLLTEDEYARLQTPQFLTGNPEARKPFSERLNLVFSARP